MVSLEELLVKTKELEREGNWTKVNEILSPEIQKAIEEGGDSEGLSDALNQRGVSRRMLGNYDQALADYNLSIKLASKGNQRAEALIGKADIERVYKKDFRAAHESLDGALQYAEEGSLTFAKVLDFKGLTSVAQEEYIAAASSYKAAREISEELHTRIPEDGDIANRHAQILHHLGAAYILNIEEKQKDKNFKLSENDNNRLKEASELNLQTLRISTEIGFNHGIYLAVTTLGRISAIKKDWNEALNHYKKAEQILEKTQYRRAIAVVSLLSAEASLAIGDLKEGERYLERFKQGFNQGEITETDKGMLRERIQNLSGLYGRNSKILKGIFNELCQ